MINIASQIILENENKVIGAPAKQDWEKAFRKSQLTWLKQLDLDKKDYFYSESAQGGNCNERDSLRFAVEKINQRMQGIKNRWWLKNLVNIKS